MTAAIQFDADCPACGKLARVTETSTSRTDMSYADSTLVEFDECGAHAPLRDGPPRPDGHAVHAAVVTIHARNRRLRISRLERRIAEIETVLDEELAAAGDDMQAATEALWIEIAGHVSDLRLRGKAIGGQHSFPYMIAMRAVAICLEQHMLQVGMYEERCVKAASAASVQTDVVRKAIRALDYALAGAR